MLRLVVRKVESALLCIYDFSKYIPKLSLCFPGGTSEICSVKRDMEEFEKENEYTAPQVI